VIARYGITTDLRGGMTVVPERWWLLRSSAQRAARIATLQCGGRHVWRVVRR
jgi:hypothetical protein